jgi:hypothetical protein
MAIYAKPKLTIDYSFKTGLISYDCSKPRIWVKEKYLTAKNKTIYSYGYDALGWADLVNKYGPDDNIELRKWVNAYKDELVKLLNKQAKDHWFKSDLGGEKSINTNEYYTMIYRKTQIIEDKVEKLVTTTTTKNIDRQILHAEKKVVDAERHLGTKNEFLFTKAEEELDELYRQKASINPPESESGTSSLIEIVKELGTKDFGRGTPSYRYLVKRKVSKQIHFDRASSPKRLGGERLGTFESTMAFNEDPNDKSKFSIYISSKASYSKYIARFDSMFGENYVPSYIGSAGIHDINPRNKRILLFWWNQSPLLDGKSGAFMLSHVKHPGTSFSSNTKDSNYIKLHALVGKIHQEAISKANSTVKKSLANIGKGYEFKNVVQMRIA